MAKIKFIDQTTKSPLDSLIYIWEPSKLGAKPIACGKPNSEGFLRREGVQSVSCKDDLKVGDTGKEFLLLRTYFDLSEGEITSVALADIERRTVKYVTELPVLPPPVVNLRFFVLSNAKREKGGMQDFLKQLVNLLKGIWKPKEPDVKKFAVNFQWDNTFKNIVDSNNTFRRIDIRLSSGAPIALKLVKGNYSNPSFNSDIPIFICHAAWDELNEPGKPRDGLLHGFTLTKKGNPWFSGERAILLFSSTSTENTLAHEMSHWCGFSHRDAENFPNNIGQ